MRIGTWNIAGRWSPRHERLLESEQCDMWLLTEVPPAFRLPGGDLVRSESMPSTRGRSWAGVWSVSPAIPLPSPHPAAAVVQIGEILICSCVLPWRGARPYWPDEGPTTAAITAAALDRLGPSLSSARCPVVWGGDWNHAMIGSEHAGTAQGRRAIEALVDALGLRVVTTDAPHQIAGLRSIDHIAVPAGWATAPCRRIVAEANGARLSDHDAYVVEVVASTAAVDEEQG